MINKNQCGHEFNETVICDKQYGHYGNHTCVKKIEPSVFQFHEWNNSKQTKIDDVGESFQTDYGEGHTSRALIMNLAIASARKNLNNGDVFEIRARPYPTEKPIMADYGRIKITRREQEINWGIAWIHIPDQPHGFEYLEIPKQPLFVYDVDCGKFNEPSGYVLLARIRNEK